MTAICTARRYGPQAPQRHHGQYSPVIEAIARQLGKSPATVRDYISGHDQLGPKVAAIVAGLKAAGQSEMAERILQPIKAIDRGITHPHLTTSLLEQHETAEGDQSVSLVRFLRDPSPKNLRALVHDIDTEIALDTELRAALAAEDQA